MLGHRHDRARIAELFDPNRILEWGFVAWIVGAAASMLFWNLSFFVGPLAKAHPEWGDLSYFIQVGYTCLAYIATYRLPRFWRRPRSSTTNTASTPHPTPTGPSDANQPVRQSWSSIQGRAVMTGAGARHIVRPAANIANQLPRSAYSAGAGRRAVPQVGHRGVHDARIAGRGPLQNHLLACHKDTDVSVGWSSTRRSDAIIDRTEVPVQTTKSARKSPNSRLVNQVDRADRRIQR